jgi:hypothetical protein
MILQTGRAFLLAMALLTAPPNWSQTTEKASPPRVSATDPEYLSCTVWDGKLWSRPAERSARTPVLESRKGSRAYGEVSVTVKGQDCENTTTLNLASSTGDEFSVVYKGRGAKGNGIRLIGWSPSGDELLAEMNYWEYETDAGFDYIPLIYDTRSHQAIEMKSADEALINHFGTDCEFEPTVEGWKSDTQILIRVSKMPGDESSEQKSCVEKPQLFVFDLEDGSVALSKK